MRMLFVTLLVVLMFFGTLAQAQMTQRYHCWRGWGRGVPHYSNAVLASDYDAGAALDLSRYANNGSVSGASYQAPTTARSGCYFFNASGQILHAHQSQYNVGGAITMFLRHYYTTTYSRWQGILTWPGESYNLMLYHSDTSATDGLNAYMRTAAGLAYAVTAAYSGTVNTWVSNGSTFDRTLSAGSRSVVYWQGTNATSGSADYDSNLSTSGSGYFYVGGTAYTLQGYIDDVLVLNRALSATEMAALNNSLMANN